MGELITDLIPVAASTGWLEKIPGDTAGDIVNASEAYIAGDTTGKAWCAKMHGFLELLPAAVTS